MENVEIDKKNKLWNKNFFLLWQGQLVSCLGDAFYSIALGFWVLEKTGSSTVMGILMTAVSIPRLVIGHFAGVIVDRFDRKKLILLGDFIRGIGMFIFNGISYILSTISETCIDVPKVERRNTEIIFREDFKEGIKCTFGFRWLVILLGVALGLNFFFAIFSILMKPWFNLDINLGVAKFGIVTAFESVGIILASVILTKIKIEARNRSKVMLSALFLQSVFFFLGVLINKFSIICVCFFIACFFNPVCLYI